MRGLILKAFAAGCLFAQGCGEGDSATAEGKQTDGWGKAHTADPGTSFDLSVSGSKAGRPMVAYLGRYEDQRLVTSKPKWEARTVEGMHEIFINGERMEFSGTPVLYAFGYRDGKSSSCRLLIPEKWVQRFAKDSMSEWTKEGADAFWREVVEPQLKPVPQK